MRSWLRRLAGFSLVPLSLLPLGVIAPVVAPSVAKRIDVLQGVALTPQPAATTALPLRNPLSVPPLAVPGHDRRHARAARGTAHHHAAKRAR
jgi:hypothetical protein